MTPFAIVGVLVAVLLAIGLAFGGSGSDSGSGGPGAARRTPPATLAQIIDRVERMRGLEFPSDPRPRKVTSAQARREGLADYDRSVGDEERRVEERVFKLLGLLEESDDLREVAGSIFGGQVAGYYDPRTKELSVVSDAAGSGTRVIDEIVLAHELNHALEDAAIGVDPSSLEECSADA